MQKSERRVRLVILVAVAGLVAAVSYPLVTRQLRIEREKAAIQWLRAVGDAQGRFRAANGGYATTLRSLTEPCRDEAPMLDATLLDQAIVDAGHEIALRSARGAEAGPLDCHGRVTATDFYVSARPVAVGQDGLRGMAMTAGGEIFAFPDGVPPTELEILSDGIADVEIED